MILVTGGAGYIGSVLVQQLLERGYAVRVLDKLLFGEQGLAAVRERIDLVEGDLRRFDPAVLDGVDAVLNLAGLSNDPMAEFHPRANWEMNTVATEAIARAARDRGIRRFVQASSCSVYDLGLQSEDVMRDEQSEVQPRAAYAVSKYEAERILLAMAGPGFCPVMLRQGTVFGYSPRLRFDLVVNTFVKDALVSGRLTVHCGGEMWRPLVDVRDAARAWIAALEAPEDKVRGEIFNVVQKNYRILELAHWVREALRLALPGRSVEIDVRYDSANARSYRVSGRKAEVVLGYRPEIPVKESVIDLVRAIEQTGVRDFLHPRYYNIDWLRALLEMEAVLGRMGSVL